LAINTSINCRISSFSVRGLFSDWMYSLILGKRRTKAKIPL
jgi:hypothetical protein